MPSNFAARFRRTAAPNLVREFGEPAIYFSEGAGSGRCINIIVERSEEILESGAVAQVIRCKAIDSCSLGIAAAEINDGRDEISISMSQGGPLERRQIVRMENDSNGMVRFRVR